MQFSFVVSVIFRLTSSLKLFVCLRSRKCKLLYKLAAIQEKL